MLTCSGRSHHKTSGADLTDQHFKHHFSPYKLTDINTFQQYEKNCCKASGVVFNRNILNTAFVTGSATFYLNE